MKRYVTLNSESVYVKDKIKEIIDGVIFNAFGRVRDGERFETAFREEVTGAERRFEKLRRRVMRDVK